MTLKYQVTLQEKNDVVAKFFTDHITVDGIPEKVPKSEYAVGELFHAIRTKKNVNLIVEGGNVDAVHAFRNADRENSRLLVRIALHRDALELEALWLQRTRVKFRAWKDNKWVADLKGSDTWAIDQQDQVSNYLVSL